MGPCVRLIRALVAQPQAQPELTEEDRKWEWKAFKDRVKRDGFRFTEKKLHEEVPVVRDWNWHDCVINGDCTIAALGPLRSNIEDENTLAGICTLTHNDGTTEEAQVVHQGSLDPRAFGSDPRLSVGTTILTANKEFNIQSCSIQNQIKCLTGTSITTDPDGTRWLGAINGGPYIA